MYCKASQLRADAVHSHGPEAKHWVESFFSEETLDHVSPAKYIQPDLMQL